MSKVIKKQSDYVPVGAYELLEAEYIEEIDSFAMRLSHKKSGAHLLLLSNDNPYKMFYITFMTPADNSRGVQHMLEHCVLAGSRKYPTGYYEKLESRLSVGYTNAVTSQDTTSFYFMARDQEEFRDCMDLYMDSVFYPKVYEDENIFKREGWRIERVTDEESGESMFQYNGIVLNEMKAHDNNYFRYIREYACKKAMPGSSQGFRSGGKSYTIPKCSYQELLEYHEKYYYPANAYIYLYGDFDVEDTLRYLDQEYLKEFSAREEILLPRTACEGNMFSLYRKNLKTDQDEEPVYRYMCLFEGKLRPDQALAFRIFEDEIESIVSDEMEKMGLTGDVDCSFVNSGIQDYLMIDFNIGVQKAGKTLRKVIKKALWGKFDQDEKYRPRLMAMMNRYELNFWEEMHSKYSAGSTLYELLENYWYYEEKYAFDVFQVCDNLQYMKNRMWGHCYNTMIRKELPRKRNEMIIEIIPQNKGGEYFQDKLQHRLEKTIEGWTDQDFAEQEADQEQYEHWENELDTEREALRRSGTEEYYQKLQAQVKEAKVSYQKSSIGKITVYHIPESQGKVVWMCLSFDADDFREHISELKLLLSFIRYRDFGTFFGMDSDEAKTFLTNYLQVDLEINRNFHNAHGPCHIRAEISTCVLEENIPDTVQMIQRMLFDVFIAISNFGDSLKDRIKNIREDLYFSPEEYYENLAGEAVDDRCFLLDQIQGKGYYEFLNRLADGGKKALKEFYINCFVMINQIFVDERLTVFCNATERGLALLSKALGAKPLQDVKNEMRKHLKKDYDDAIKSERNYEERMELRYWKKFVLKNHDADEAVPACQREDACRGPQDGDPRDTSHQQDISAREGTGSVSGMHDRALVIPSNVNHIAFYGCCSDSYDYRTVNLGALQLAAGILEDRYLRRELRERGGAYGYEVSIYTSGSMAVTSYRDPHLKRTLQVIKSCGEYIRDIKMSEEELWDYKNSYLNKFLDNEDNDPWLDQDNVRNIEMKGLDADIDERIVEQVFRCTVKDIRQTSGLIEQMLSHGRFYVLGSKSALKRREALFEQMEELAGGEETPVPETE